MSDPQDTQGNLPEELPGTEPPTEEGRANVPPEKDFLRFPKNYTADRYDADMEAGAVKSALVDALREGLNEIKLDPRTDWRLGVQFLARATLMAHPYHIAADALKSFMRDPGKRAIILRSEIWPSALCFKAALKACSVLCRLGLDVRVVIGEDREDSIFLGLELVDVPQLPPDAFRALTLQPLPTDDPKPEPSKHPVLVVRYRDTLPDYIEDLPGYDEDEDEDGGHI